MTRTKLILILSALFLLNLSIKSQVNPDNSWINYSQKYFKIPVVENGIYRLGKNTLLNAGVPVDAIDPRNLQLFHKGKEQTVYIPTGNFAYLFEDNEFIEFYGEKNTGWLDTAMYDSPDHQANPYYSLINDTAYYFLTWNTSTNNRRYEYIENQNYDNQNLVEYCFIENHKEYNSTYHYGEESPYLTSGEGWLGNAFNIGEQSNVSINLPDLYNGDISGELEFCVAGGSKAASTGGYNHHLRAQFSNVSWDTLYYAYDLIKRSFTLTNQQLQQLSGVLFSTIYDQGLASDRNIVAYVKYKYPNNFNFNQNSLQLFSLPQTTNNFVEIHFQNFESNEHFLYNIDKQQRIRINSNNNTYKAVVETNTNKATPCYYFNQDAVRNINSIRKVSSSGYFTDFLTQYRNANYLIVTTKTEIFQKAQLYRDYRESSGYRTAFLPVEELYDQFAYGIQKHPLSIRNFVKAAINQWDSVPEYLFLIGKSIHPSLYRKTLSWHYYDNFVPSMGEPSSDMLLTFGLTGNSLSASIPTGRLSAKYASQVEAYLNKVIEYESNEQQEWMKNVIHFGGGANINEQNQLAGYLNNYKNIIEDTLYGATVSTFLKNSSLPIQITQSDSIRNLINNGTSLLTFFGHASASGFDQNIDDPEAYFNVGKYPILLANSCFAGDIHLKSASSTSEKWVLIENKGVVGFLASVGEGSTNFLNIYSSELYKQISYKNYNKSIGKCIKETINEIIDQSNPNIGIINTCLEFTLHGDPAIIPNSASKPDLMINSAAVDFTPAPVSTAVDSFTVQVVSTNISMAVTDSFIVEIERTKPNNTTQLYHKILPHCLYKDTLYFTLPTDYINGPGINNLHIKLDANNTIDELSENNNEIYYDFLITSGDILPVYPYEYSIYPNNNATLIASTATPFSSGNYIFRVDTCDTFNSPSLWTSQAIQSTGGVVEQEIPFTLTENRVYYWQVAAIDNQQEPNNWRESSFIYIPGKTGWSQAHFHQFKNDYYRFIDYNRNQRKFDFIETPKELHCYNLGLANSVTGYNIRYTIDGSVLDGDGDYSSCGSQPAMMVAVIDSFSLKAWESNTGYYGQRNYPKCPERNRPDYYFVFNSNSSGFQGMVDLINNVPEGNYILIYSYNSGKFQSWPETAYATLEGLGAATIRDVGHNHPYIFFCKKGYPETAEWREGNTNTQEINLYTELATEFNYGYIQSSLIGPINNANTLKWDFNSLDAVDKDTNNLKVFGLNNIASQGEHLFSLNENNLETNNLSDSITSTSNYLKLEYHTTDDSLRTPGQLEKWQVYYDEVPETALNPSEIFIFKSDTIKEGDNLQLVMATENISSANMDSLLIQYKIFNSSGEEIQSIFKRKAPHPAGDILTDTLTKNTLGMSGAYMLQMEVNPVNPETGTYDQAEQYHFNNLAQIRFIVKQDELNPLLDVTFDGVHIMNNELISAKPEIMIKLKDENPFLALDDTSLVDIYLTNVDEGTTRKINLSQPNITFQPAAMPDNACKIRYLPEFEKDGTYALRVKAKDKSNNQSGDYDYEISFKVILKSTITNILNYPNPFSTATNFVFELTGSEIPEVLKVQIFTITGKFVKEIDLLQSSNIRIGKNISDVYWDGTDMYGDPLANGVYFYKVITRIDNASIEKRDTKADTFFKKGFGKMYLMR